MKPRAGSPAGAWRPLRLAAWLPVCLVAWILGGLALPASLPAQQESAADGSRAEARAGAVAGTVVEEVTGRPLPGARVSVPEAGVADLTDARGRFLLPRIPAGAARVRVELIGYASSERTVQVEVGGRSAVEFGLRVQALGLDEIVVTGAASQARMREVGHTVGQIRPDALLEPVASLDQLLAARVPGLTVIRSGGMAGSGSQVRLRGNVSVTLSNQPLVYVDGVRVRSDGYPKNAPPVGPDIRGANDVASPLNDIDPGDVERVDVIRGSAASTLYGTEAAAGVIQIFTRRGAAGSPVLRTRIDQGWERVRPFGPKPEPYMRMDPWLRTAWNQRYAASLSGGVADARYFVSGRYGADQGVLPNDLAESFGLRGNVDVQPRADLDLGWYTAFTYQDIQNTPAGSNSHGITFNAIRGDQNFLNDGSKEAMDRLLDYRITSRFDRLISAVSAAYRPSAWFTHRLTLGYDRAAADLRQLRPFGFPLAPEGILSDERWEHVTATADYLGTVERELSRDLRATVSWGGQLVSSEVSSVAGYGEGLAGPGEPTLSSAAFSRSFEHRMRTRNGGFFGQLVLGWQDRYFATGGLRLDGYSAFGEEQGLQAYPRANASWILSEEPFWPQRGGVVKLRAAYGEAGRAPGAFDAVRSWTSASLEGEPAFLPASVGNPHLGPERTAEIELGLDVALLDERLRGDFTYYRQRTTDALFPVLQVPSLGFLGTQLENVGALRNAGVELSVDAELLRSRDLGWSLGAQLSTNHSRVTDLGGAAELSLGELGWIVEGQPAPVIRGSRILNPDAFAEPEIEEDYFYGPNLPTHVIGLRSALRLGRAVELSAHGDYMGGHYMQDRASRHIAQRNLWPVCTEAYEHLAAGRREQTTAWERAFCDAQAVPRDGPVYPADFFRLRDVSLRVALPWTPLGARGTSATLSAGNFWTWKNRDFLAFDPEIAGEQGMNAPVRGITAHVPPPAALTLTLRAVW